MILPLTNKARFVSPGNDENQKLPDLRLDFTPLSLAAWRDIFRTMLRSTLSQSYDYGVAIAAHEQQRPLWAIIRIDGNVAGCVQILETRLLGRALHTVAIDRGPIWAAGYGTPEQMIAFWTAIDNCYPRRFGRRRRFIPEAEPKMLPALTAAGLQPITGGYPYQTSWVDLTADPDVLRAGLLKNWRGSLKKAEQNQQLTVRFDPRGDMAEWLLYVYDADRRARSYRGPSVKLTRALIKSFAKGDGMVIGWVEDQGQPVAGLLVLCHGQCATWQIGWVGAAARQSSANHLLVWRTLEWLKARGFRALDLGGMNDEDAKGVKDFKAGLNGEHVILCGQYA